MAATGTESEKVTAEGGPGGRAAGVYFSQKLGQLIGPDLPSQQVPTPPQPSCWLPLLFLLQSNLHMSH